MLSFILRWSCYIKEKWQNKLNQIKYRENIDWIVSSKYSGSPELPERECILFALSVIFVVVWYRWPPVDRGWYSAQVLLWPPHTDSCRLFGKVIQMSSHTRSCYLFFDIHHILIEWDNSFVYKEHHPKFWVYTGQQFPWWFLLGAWVPDPNPVGGPSHPIPGRQTWHWKTKTPFRTKR